MELWPGPRGAAVRGGFSAFRAEMWLCVVGRWGWHVDFDAHTDDFLARLGEKGTFLPLEKAARGAGSHLGEAGGGCGGEEGHELMTCGWGGVLSRGGVGVLGEVEVWARSVGMMGRGDGESPRKELGERGRLEGWDFTGGLRSAAVVVEAEEEEGEGEWFVTGRRWKDIALDGGREGGRGDYIVVSRSCMTDRRDRAGNPVLEAQDLAQARGAGGRSYPSETTERDWTVSGPLAVNNETARDACHEVAQQASGTCH